VYLYNKQRCDVSQQVRASHVGVHWLRVPTTDVTTHVVARMSGNRNEHKVLVRTLEPSECRVARVLADPADLSTWTVPTAERPVRQGRLLRMRRPNCDAPNEPQTEIRTDDSKGRDETLDGTRLSRRLVISAFLTCLMRQGIIIITIISSYSPSSFYPSFLVLFCTPTH
jgi:hypothetical protein